MPTAVLSIRREHVEAFIVAELERTSPSSAAMRYRSLQTRTTCRGYRPDAQGAE
jgi:hypothetical protein